MKKYMNIRVFTLAIIAVMSFGCKKSDEKIVDSCLKGEYLNENECKAAPLGTFAPGDGKYYTCPVGMYAEREGQITCSVCKNKPSNADLVAYAPAETAVSRFCPVDKVLICSVGYKLEGGSCNRCTNVPANADGSIFSPNTLEDSGSCKLLTVVCNSGYSYVGESCVDNTPTDLGLVNRSVPSTVSIVTTENRVSSGHDVPVSLACEECSGLIVNGIESVSSVTLNPGDTFSLKWEGGLAINTQKTISYTHGETSGEWQLFGVDTVPDRTTIETNGISPSPRDTKYDPIPVTVESQPFSIFGAETSFVIDCKACVSLTVNGTEYSPATATVSASDSLKLKYSGIILDGSTTTVPFSGGGVNHDWKIFAEDFPDFFTVSLDPTIPNEPYAQAKSYPVFIAGMNYGEAQISISDTIGGVSTLRVNNGPNVSSATIKKYDTIVFYSEFTGLNLTHAATISIKKNSATMTVPWFISTRLGKRCSLDGVNIYSGDKVKAYTEKNPLVACASIEEERSCEDGILSGSNPYVSCKEPCGTPGGGVIASGAEIAAYSSAKPADLCSSVKETRVCNNGTLSGTNVELSCTDGCVAPWGVYVADSSTTEAFDTDSSGACLSEMRSCSNQVLSGSYRYMQCASFCKTADNVLVLSGDSITLFSETKGACYYSSTQMCAKTGFDGDPSHKYANCVVGCDPGYHVEGPSCVSDVRSCYVENGTGTQTWNGTDYGVCTVTSCNLGYYNSSNACAPMRKCRGSVYSATYSEPLNGSDDVQHQESSSSGGTYLAGKDFVLKYQWRNNNNGVTYYGTGPIPDGLIWTTGYGYSGGTRIMQIEMLDRPEYYSVQTCTETYFMYAVSTYCFFIPSYYHFWMWWDGSWRLTSGGSLTKGSFLRYEYSYVYPSSSCTPNYPTDMGIVSGPQ